jgi:elongation factor G
LKKYKSEQIRNVGLIGHAASGKTSLAEAILYITGVSDRLGKVGDSSSVMDYDPEEMRRGHSISASVAFCEWNKCKINIVDTAGSGNFITDTPACLRVVDGAVIVVSACDGLQFYTEKVWAWADAQGLPCLVFITQLDRERANLQSTLDSIKKKLNKKLALLHVPVGRVDKFSGIADLVARTCFQYQAGGKGQGVRSPVPHDIEDEVEIRRAELVETVAETDDALLEHYLENGELTAAEFESGLKKAIRAGSLIPVLIGAPPQNVGTDLLVQAIIDFLPAASQRPAVQVRSTKDNSSTTLKGDETGPLAALVFKTIADPHAGKLTLFRVFSGVVKSDSNVYNAARDIGERVGTIFALQGKKQVAVSEVSAGDMGAVAKLKATLTGDSLCAEGSPVAFDAIVFPKPVLARALIPKTRADEEKISNALHRLTEEDPTLHIDRDPHSHELLVSGLGQVHLDVMIERLKRRFGVEVNMKPPKVPYRETIRGSTKVQGKYKRQTGGHGQYGDAWLEIQPLERGKGFVFENKVVGGAIPKNYIPAVEKGVHEALAQGALAHFPMVDVKVVLYDGSYHDVDSSEMAFKIAGSMAFKKGVLDCKPVLLEPVMSLQVSVPSETVGDVIGDLNAKRGKILGIDAGEESQSISVHVPMATVLNYASDLTAITAGRGSFGMEFSHYDDMPDPIAAKIVEDANREYQANKKDE